MGVYGKMTEYSDFVNKMKIFRQTYKAILAIDFDGTIVEDFKYPKFGDFIEDSIKYINKLYDEGYYIIIWTCRSKDIEIKELVELFEKHGLKYHKINRNADFEILNSNPKIYADIYIDDKQIYSLPPWKRIYEFIKNKFN